jgi:hypothetical protein
VIGCVVKALCDVKSWFETWGDKKSSHIKGWCGSCPDLDGLEFLVILSTV